MRLYGYKEIIYGNGNNIAKEVFYDVFPIAGVRFSYEYQYDNLTNPLQVLGAFIGSEEDGSSYFSKNNAMKKIFTTTSQSETTTYSYLYNADGYPTKATASDGKITEYEYQ